MTLEHTTAKRRWLSVAIALTLCALLGAGTALARGTGAILGYPASPAGHDCFSHVSGQITNLCPATQTWILPIIADNSGNSGPQVRARGLAGTSRSVCCRFFSFTNSGAASTRSSNICTRLHTGDIETLTASLSIPGGGAYFASCSVPQNTALLNLHY